MFDPAQFRLDGKTAIVTGAGAGIGRGIALMFAGAGAAVVVSDLKAETAEAVAKEITAAGGRATGVACNVTRTEDLAAVVPRRSTISASSTSSSTTQAAAGRSPSTCRWRISAGPTNSTCSRSFACRNLQPPYAGGGRRRDPEHLLDGGREQEHPDGLLCIVQGSREPSDPQHRLRSGPDGHPRERIAPGAIKTDALASVLTPEIEKAMLKHTPLGRLGEAADIAQAALFLCAPASSWISGQCSPCRRRRSGTRLRRMEGDPL